MNMHKYVSLVFLFVLSFNSNATCKLSDKTSNSMITPVFWTSGTIWKGGFYVTNVSNVPVTVKLELTDYNGATYTAASTQFAHNFSSGNSPLDLSSGAVLQPGQLGIVWVLDPSTIQVNVGHLSWESSVCIQNALMVTATNEFVQSTRMGVDKFHLNNGLPF